MNTKRKKGPKKEKVIIVVIVNQVKTAICPVLRTGSTKNRFEPFSGGMGPGSDKDDDRCRICRSWQSRFFLLLARICHEEPGAYRRYPLAEIRAVEKLCRQGFSRWAFLLERGYAWNANRGTTLEEAFRNVELIVEIVERSQQGDWGATDRIPFRGIGKWKIAFLFPNKRLVPVYSRGALKAIAAGLGLLISANAPVSAFHLGILSQKPPGEDVLLFSRRVYTAFAAKDTDRQYFIIGSIYDEYGSVMPEFLKRGCVAMGWIDCADFSGLMAAGRKEIDEYVDGNYTDESPRPQTIKSYFRIFSNITEGDIIV